MKVDSPLLKLVIVLLPPIVGVHEFASCLAALAETVKSLMVRATIASRSVLGDDVFFEPGLKDDLLATLIEKPETVRLWVV
jgi:hypothetical protein